MAVSDSYSNTTLYLFSMDPPKGHSLLKLDIAMPPNEEGDWIVSSPQVIHHFRSDNDRGRIHMGCGQLNSKLYILGGLREYEFSELEYPLDVMVFDPAALDPSSDSSFKSFNVSPMNSPKIGPTMFEAGGKLYVLGIFTDEGYGASTGRDIFEEYDPETDQWKVLENPPIYYHGAGWGVAFVLDSTTVVIEGNERTILHIFNPTTYEWTKLEIYLDECYFFGYQPLLVEDCLYGAVGGGTFVKAGPISISPPHNGIHKLVPSELHKEVATVEWGGTDSNSFPKYWMQEPSICYLGDWRFCVVESASPVPDDICDCREIFFDVYIHKIIDHGKGSLKAKCLQAVHFNVKSGRDWVDSIMSCHLITNGSSK